MTKFISSGCAAFIIGVFLTSTAYGHGTVPFSNTSVWHRCKNSAGVIRTLTSGGCMGGETVIHVAKAPSPTPAPCPTGCKGDKGDKGDKGETGLPGLGVPGAAGKDGKDGVDGKDGAPGLDCRPQAIEPIPDPEPDL